MLVEIIVFIAFLILLLKNIFYHLFWWEKKEYRFDRMLVHLRETYQGKKWLFGPLCLIKWFLLFFYLISPQIIINYLIYSVFIFEAIKDIYEFKFGWKIPPLKPRIIGTFLITILVLFSIILYIRGREINLALSLLIADKLMGPLISFLFYISNNLFSIYKKIKINKASQKIKQAEHLKIIGITGSYGKTTTKELIAQILSQKYKVLKTLGSQNTDIGIAERILSSNLKSYDYFVCEMAAYKKGEIAEICNILKPKIEIAVITGINEQHQSLFGSLENTKRAKFELVEALTPSGYAIFNGKSKHIDDLVRWARKKKIRVEVVRDIANIKLPAQLYGEHFKENLLLSIVVARILGLSDQEIKEGIKKTQLPSKTMNMINMGKLKLIDDSFNANPDGVYAALSYLKKIKKRKILVLQPLIELGNYTEEVHQKIGRLAASICDLIILTNKNFNNYFMEGAKVVKGGIEKINIGKFPTKIEEGVILFEGKESEKYLNIFKISQIKN